MTGESVWLSIRFESSFTLSFTLCFVVSLAEIARFFACFVRARARISTVLSPILYLAFFSRDVFLADSAAARTGHTAHRTVADA